MTELQMWLASISILKAQRGYFIYRYAKHDLRIVINELIRDKLSSEDGGQVVMKHIQRTLPPKA
eukprot:9235273-Pyramimonas_sp.AAC.1